jgi:hypothetical protein
MLRNGHSIRLSQPRGPLHSLRLVTLINDLIEGPITPKLLECQSHGLSQKGSGGFTSWCWKNSGRDQGPVFQRETIYVGSVEWG